jgi:hypothetical protein
VIYALTDCVVISAAHYEVDDSMKRKDWPYQAGQGGNPANGGALDMSWLSNWVTGNDNFVRILQPERPHITIIDKDIFGEAVGLSHIHPLNGSKFW